jgi:hypothetical protein
MRTASMDEETGFVNFDPNQLVVQINDSISAKVFESELMRIDDMYALERERDVFRKNIRNRLNVACVMLICKYHTDEHKKPVPTATDVMDAFQLGLRGRLSSSCVRLVQFYCLHLNILKIMLNFQTASMVWEFGHFCKLEISCKIKTEPCRFDIGFNNVINPIISATTSSGYTKTSSFLVNTPHSDIYNTTGRAGALEAVLWEFYKDVWVSSLPNKI